ncbi:hypothetical protein BC835DRAFT_1414453 [Cytidiella melzeri]|nr:hypothetical protein BC835DRAFT_1414453 [Cytidiella melzeri]
MQLVIEFIACRAEWAYVLSKASRISAIAVDWLVLCLTWAKLSSYWQEKRFCGRDIGTMLLRNGSIYFAVLLFLNSAEIVVFQLTRQDYVTEFIAVITSILMSRFMMNLRNVKRPSYSAGTSGGRFDDLSESRISSYIAGDFGEDLSHGFLTDDDAEDSVMFASSLRYEDNPLRSMQV